MSDYKWIHPSEMKPSDRRKWSIDKQYICHPIGVNTGGFPLEGRRWWEYVLVVWGEEKKTNFGTSRSVVTYSIMSNYRFGVVIQVRGPVQLMLI